MGHWKTVPVKGPGGPGQQQIGRESAVCPGSQEGQPSPGVHCARHCRLGEGRDCPSLLCTAAASPGALGALLGTAEHKRHSAIGDCSKEGTRTGRSDVQSFIGIHYLFRLGHSHIPHPMMRNTTCMGLGSHSILEPHAEPESCCPLVFHLTSYNPASHCPRKGPEPAGGTGSPCQGSGDQGLAFLLHNTKEAFLSITATIPVPLPACNPGFQLSALTSPWGSLLVSGPQWGPLILQETSLFLLTWSS